MTVKHWQKYVDCTFQVPSNLEMTICLFSLLVGLYLSYYFTHRGWMPENMVVLVLGFLPTMVLIINVTLFTCTPAKPLLPIYEPSPIHFTCKPQKLISRSKFGERETGDSAFIAVRRSADPEKVFEEANRNGRVWSESLSDFAGLVRRASSPFITQDAPSQSSSLPELTQLTISK